MYGVLEHAPRARIHPCIPLTDQLAADVQVSDLPLRSRPPSAEAAALGPLVSQSMQRVEQATKRQGYLAWLGFYNTFTKRLGWSKEEVVRRANAFASIVLGLSEPPPIEAKTARKMGLSGVKGLVYGAGEPKQGGGGGGGGAKGKGGMRPKGGGKGGGGKGRGGKGGGGKGGGGKGGGGPQKTIEKKKHKGGKGRD